MVTPPVIKMPMLPGGMDEILKRILDKWRQRLDQLGMFNRDVEGNLLLQMTPLGSAGTDLFTADRFISRSDGSSTLSSSIALPVRTTTSSILIESYNFTILADAAANAISLYLPEADQTEGRIYIVKKVDSSANTVTVVAAGVNLIDLAATDILTSQDDTRIYQSNGLNNWYTLARRAQSDMTDNVQNFTASGTWTMPIGWTTAMVDVELTGGGGGGAGGDNAAHGGGGGGSSETKLQRFVVSANQTVTLGGGGAGGAVTVDGSNGSSSTFGSLLTAVGGLGGKSTSGNGGAAVGESTTATGSTAVDFQDTMWGHRGVAGGGAGTGTGLVGKARTNGFPGGASSGATGGGGGGSTHRASGGAGGAGAVGVAAVANSGAGGGGGGQAFAGAAGGSGYCLVMATKVN